MTSPAGRVLGVDLGDARIGLALSDPIGLTAQPLETLRRVGPRRDLEYLQRLVAKHGVTTVVVGLPLMLSGAEGPRSVAAREFGERLRGRMKGLEIEMWDERLTTVEAERRMIEGNVRRRKRKKIVDALAAVLILQGYLDSRSVPAE